MTQKGLQFERACTYDCAGTIFWPGPVDTRVTGVSPARSRRRIRRHLHARSSWQAKSPKAAPPTTAAATTESPAGGFAASPEGDHPRDDGAAASAREVERLRRELARKHDELLTAARLGKGLLEREEALKQALAGERARAAAARGELEAVWQRNAELRRQLTTLQVGVGPGVGPSLPPPGWRGGVWAMRVWGGCCVCACCVVFSCYAFASHYDDDDDGDDDRLS